MIVVYKMGKERLFGKRSNFVDGTVCAGNIGFSEFIEETEPKSKCMDEVWNNLQFIGLRLETINGLWVTNHKSI